MRISNKLNRILEYKGDIAEAINQKGGLITENTPLSQYASKINQLKTKAPPEISSFSITPLPNHSATVTGQTEINTQVKLYNPNGLLIPLNVNLNGSFSGTIPSELIEGEYRLEVIDIVGNITVIYEMVNRLVITDPIIRYFIENPDLLGFYYDINDLSTLFQDAEGTIPVTAVGQTVGMIKDKSGSGFHLKQDTASRQAKLSFDVESNSYCLLGDNIDDYYICLFNFPLLSGLGASRIQVDTGLCFKRLNASSRMIFDFSSSNAPRLQIGSNYYLGSIRLLYTENNLNRTIPIDTNQLKHIMSVYRESNELVKFKHNNISYGNNINPTLLSFNQLVLTMGGYFFKGYAVFNAALTDGQRQEFSDYMNTVIGAY